MKKNPKEFDKLTDEYFKNCEEKKLSKPLCNYVWKVLVAYSRGYGFNKSHTLAYSLIALQEMNLAYRFPIIFWNTACLISDAGGNDSSEDIDEEIIEELKIEKPYYEEMEEFNEESDEEESSYDEDESESGFPATIVITKDGTKKKKVKATNYGKISAAIGKIQSTGVNVMGPDINLSNYTFTPDIATNSIRYGLSGITRISSDLIKNIMLNRPYNDIGDFLNKVKLNKTQMINLIKAGTFDSFGDRTTLMKNYIGSISDRKNAINLRNLQALINYNLLPEQFNFEIKCFNFNKYLKKFKNGNWYEADNNILRFYGDNFSMDDFIPSDESSVGFKLAIGTWDKHWKEAQNKLRPWIKAHENELKDTVNKIAFYEVWDKYAEGDISKWEMDSLSCYIHRHELSQVNLDEYGITDFFKLKERPQIDRYIPIKGKQVPLFKLERIAGTVLDRDKNKKTISLLTTKGVVTVKIYGGVFQEYDKQISERGADGKKHVIARSMFSRGNKIIVTGIREEDSFLAKTYSRTPWHKVEQIIDITPTNELIIKAERV